MSNYITLMILNKVLLNVSVYMNVNLLKYKQDL